MYPLKSIIDFLLAGVSRIPAEERVHALLAMFSGLLPDMTPDDIVIAREQVIARFWTSPATTDEVLNLIDGHVALREMFAGGYDETESDVTDDQERGPERRIGGDDLA